MNPPADRVTPKRQLRVAGLRQAAEQGPLKDTTDPGPGEQPPENRATGEEAPAAPETTPETAARTAQVTDEPAQAEPGNAERSAPEAEPAGKAERVGKAVLGKLRRGPADATGRPSPVVALLAAGVVLAAGIVSFLTYDLLRQRAAAEAREKALAAAELHAPTLLSYDYRHLDQDLVKAQAALTGDFKKQYTETFTKIVKPTATQYRAVVVGNVASAGVIWAKPDEAQVLMFVNQQATNSQLPAPRLDLSRVRMTLKKTDDGWRVSNIEAL